MGTGFSGGPYYKDFWRFTGGNITTNINESNIESSISIFPNPSNGKFTLSSEITKGEISIYNISGEKIHSSKPNSTKSEIDLSKEPNGIYFLQIKTTEGIANKKIIISK